MKIKTEQHSLITNGLDFLEASVNNLTGKENGKIKYAVLHLFSGTLLILKERIRHEHWSLLFQKAESASLRKYESGDFEGITFDRVLHVLKEVAQLTIDPEDERALAEIRKIRNRVEHFEYSISIERFRPLAGRVLSFVVGFIEQNLQDATLTAEETEIFSDIKTTSAGFREYVDERLKAVEKFSSQKNFDLFYCVECHEKSLVKEPEDFRCFVCGVVGADTDEVIDSHFVNTLNIYHDPTDGSELPLHDCPECETRALVPEEKTFENFFCVNCSARVATTHLHSCSDCGEVFVDSDSEAISICHSCTKYRLRDD